MTIERIAFLDTVIKERIVPMLKEVSTIAQVPLHGDGVYSFFTDKPRAPFVWLYPGSVGVIKQSSDLGIMSVTCYARYVLGYRKDGYIGSLQDYMWTLIPTIHQYFLENNGLCYLPNQVKPAHLRNVQLGEFSPFGVFDDGSDHVGMEMPINLSFHMVLNHVAQNS